MTFLDSVLKIFVGDKSKQDVKAIMPIVEKIKTFEAALEKLSHDELRAKTIAFKEKIAEVRKPYQDSIDKLLARSEEHTSELQSRPHLVCRLLLEKKKKKKQ